MIYSTCKCDARPSVRYLTRGGKKKFGEGLKPLLGSKAKPSPPKQSVKFKRQIWFEINRKFSKKFLDVSSL